MKEVNVRLDNDEILMATVLLLFVTYYPDYPPLKSFANVGFQGRRDFITLVEDGAFVFTEIENCSREQIQFFQKKIEEMEFSGDISVENNVTRISIFPKNNS